MAIPIKCAGCQAAFDVPETLAGKTIRCTSCKTELKVPTPSAAKPAPPKAVPSAKPAKLDLDDEDDVKKSKPGKPKDSKSKAAARRRDDDDDDDDDDEDERPRRKKAKSGGNGGMIALIGGGVVGLLAIIGVVVYLMMGSSDDKKKETASSSSSTSSTSGGPPAGAPSGAPGGGPPSGMGGGPPPGMGGGPPPGMVGPGMSGPGMAGPGPGIPGAGGGANIPPGWQQINTNGFSFAMPGQPQQQQINANGANMTVYVHESPDKKGGYIILYIDLPGNLDEQQSRLVLNKMIEGMTQGGGGGGGPTAGRWGNRFGGGGGGGAKVRNKRDTTLDGFPAVDFEADAPGASALLGRGVVGNSKLVLALTGHEGDPNHNVSGDGAKFIATLKMNGQMAGGGPGFGGPPPGGAGPGGPPGGLTPGYGPPPGLGGGGPPPGGLNPGFGGPPPGGMNPGFGGPPPGSTPGFGGPPPGGIGQGGPPPGGIGQGGPPPGGIGQGGPPPGGIGQGGPPPGGIGQGGPPPGGIGQGGPPPGFNPGGQGAPGFGGPNSGFANQRERPPAGAATRPKIISKLDQFHAFAFDADQNEFYTVAIRPDPKSPARGLGTLRRYTYPDFNPKAEFNIPNVATRAVIDSKKGLLYVASVTNQAQMNELRGNSFDRGHGSGDIHVYDLEPIRSGKVADGSDLKPIATIQQGGTIRGLELGNENKHLFVLLTRTGSKSVVRQYDTTDRRLVKDVPLGEEAAEMVQSVDGKHLWVIEFDRTFRKPKTSITSLDTSSLEKKTKVGPGVVTDLTTAPDGSRVAAVAGAGNPPNVRLGQIFSIGENGTQEILQPGWKASHNNYVKMTPDGKHLFVSSFAGRDQAGHLSNPGFDVYMVDGANFKKAASIQSAIQIARSHFVGGYFHITPNGEHVIFNSGVVLSVAKLTTNAEGAQTVPEPEGSGGNGNQAGPGMQRGPGFPGAAPGAPGAAPGFPGAPGAAPGFPGGVPGAPGAAPGFPGGAPLPGGALGAVPGAAPVPGGAPLPGGAPGAVPGGAPLPGGAPGAAPPGGIPAPPGKPGG